MRKNYLKRPSHLGGARALLFPAGLLLELTLGSGCAKVCSDDGFAWQQDPSCLQNTSDSDSDSDSNTDSDPTDTVPTTTDNETTVYCTDADGDGYGDADKCTEVPDGQTPPEGTVPNDDDCDDSDEFTFPGAAPNDDPDACMTDKDGDDWGDMDPPGEGGPGEPQPGTDCDDNDPNTFPGSAELDSMTECMKDSDGDGHGDDDPPGGPDGPIKPGNDCDDDDPDEWDMCGPTCVDADMDGWFESCSDGMFPADKPLPDCDDNDPNTFPGAAPKDDETACMTDADGDDYGDDTPAPGVTPGTDCDDDDEFAFPGSAPKDDLTACMADKDGDDHGDADPSNPNVTPGNDCNDNHIDINPSDSILITAHPAVNNVADVSEIDWMTGVLTSAGTLDTTGFNPWSPTSLAVHPNNRTVYAALATKTRLVTMNYCGAGVPTTVPEQHGKELCAIGFDKSGTLWGVDAETDQLIQFNENGGVVSETELTFDGKLLNLGKCGMTWDCHQSRLLLSDASSDSVYSLDTGTAVATKIADLAGEFLGAGLAYEPVSKRVLSVLGTMLYSIAIDGSNAFDVLPELMSDNDIDDLEFAPGCN